LTTLGGGSVAAYGLKYQYLATLEYFLRYLREHPELIARTTLVVEPILEDSDGVDDDIVDFGIEVDDVAVHHLQVKATTNPDRYRLQPSDARVALDRLLRHAADNSVLLTNKPLSSDLASKCAIADAEGLATTYTWAEGPQPGPDAAPRQVFLAVDNRTPAELRTSIAELVRHFRRIGSLKQGLTSARLLVGILLDFIFDAAAGLEPARITALDLLAKVHMPDARMAQLAGGFDWGLPMSGIPNYGSTVARMAILDEIVEHLATDDTREVPELVVLAGHTGIGKSVIATDYCHADRISYEFLCWIDCRDTEMIAPRIRDIVAQLTKNVVSPAADVSRIFAGILGRIAGPWLLIFDGIQNASDIESYVPAVGCGSILITTNNSLGWWDTAHQMQIGAFTEDEASECFTIYAAIPSEAVDEVREPIREIGDRLGRIPLAVSMAGLYFRNTQGRLDELAVQYFADLAALDDSFSVPRGFGNKTAFDAIRYAVENLGKGTRAPHRRDTQKLLYAGSLLAPELLPLNLLLPATVEALHISITALPRPAEVEAELRRGVIATLRTQTIAHRVTNAEPGVVTPASDTVAVHPLVHSILQRICLARVGPGDLQQMAASLMYFLVGWIGILRTEGHFFAVEQLRMHAEALIELVNEREPLSTVSADHDKHYRYLKAMLQSELGTCQFSRGNLQEAYNLGLAAVQALSTIPADQNARIIAMKCIFDQIHDLSMGEAPAGLLAIHAHLLVQFCNECEANPKESFRDVAYRFAGEALAMVTRTAAYRESPPLQAIADQLNEIGARDPKPETRAHTRNAIRTQMVDAGEYQAILDTLPEWRSADGGIHNAVIFDGLAAVAQLHTGRFDDAIAVIGTILDLKPYGQHLLIFTHEALKKVAKALHQVIPTAGPDAGRLQQALGDVLARYHELGGTSNDGSSA
jgi:hypothetical protein